MRLVAGVWQDAAWRRAVDYGVHVVRRLLHETLPCRLDGQALVAVPQDTADSDTSHRRSGPAVSADRRRSDRDVEQRGSA